MGGRVVNKTSKQLDVVIAGGGIGGLTSALCLEKSGHKVQVIEQQAAPAATGAGIQLGANALRVFDYLGLLSAIRSIAVQPSKVLFRDFQTGNVLYEMGLGEKYVAKYGAPYLHIHRADLLKILHAAWAEKSALGVLLDTRVLGFEESDEGVKLALSGDQSRTCDLLIAADGVRSGCRSQLLGDTQPRYTGHMAWRATVPASALPNNWMETITSNFIGPKKHAVLYYVRNRELANFVGVVERPNPNGSSSWVSRGNKVDLHADFAGWHDTVQSIIDAVPEDECYCWDLYDHPPLNNWSSCRVTLLGDAAHATLPFMASGAAMAIEDGRILQRSLDESRTLEQGLQCYQRNRLSRTRKVQESSRDFGKIYHIEQGWMRRIAFSGIRVVGPWKERFLPSYDPNRVPLI